MNSFIIDETPGQFKVSQELQALMDEKIREAVRRKDKWLEGCVQNFCPGVYHLVIRTRQPRVAARYLKAQGFYVAETPKVSRFMRNWEILSEYPAGFYGVSF